MSHVDIDYSKLLCQSLEKDNLMYIVDILLDVKEQMVDDLFVYTRNDLVEILRNINDDETNKHKIKTAHRYKFAKLTNKIADHKNRTEKAKKTSKTVQFLVITKAEEETIESIQFGQQFMKKTSLKMSRLLNNLTENNENITKNLKEICNLLKKQIDTKEKEMMKIINDIDNMYSFQLQQQNQSTQQSAQSVAKFYNNYENCFTNDNMSQLDRKQELISSKQDINIEMDKLMKYQDLTYNIDLVFNNNIVNRFFEKCIKLTNPHIDILPAMTRPQIIGIMGSTIKWDVPIVPDEVIKIFSDKLSIKYQILYRQLKDDIEWNKIDNLIHVTSYDIKNYIKPPYEVKIKYNVNNIFLSHESPIVSSTIDYDQVIKTIQQDMIFDQSSQTPNKIKVSDAYNVSGDTNAYGSIKVKYGMPIKSNNKYGIYSISWQVIMHGGGDYDTVVGVISSKAGPVMTKHAKEGLLGVYGITYSNNQIITGEKAKKITGYGKRYAMDEKIMVEYMIETETLKFYQKGIMLYEMKLLVDNETNKWYPYIAFYQAAESCKLMKDVIIKFK